jgi:hypothetical protein
MHIGNLVLEFLKVLIWPSILLFIAIRYRRPLDRLITRFCEETEEITSKSLGITAKFRRAVDNLSEISKKLPDDQQEVRAAIDDARQDLIQNQIRELSENFFRLGLSGREKTASLIYNLATEIDLDFVLQLSKSEFPAERVASGVCIKALLNEGHTLIGDERLTDALRAGIQDAYSRVRYRYVEAIVSRHELISRFQRQLFKIAKSDDNEAVRDLAQTVLDAI